MQSSDRTHPPPQRPLRGLTVGIGAAIAVSGCVLIALVVFIGLRSNSAELQAERLRIENALSQSVERALEQQKTIAWWDDAVEHVSNRFDLAFADANFGYYFTETFGHDEVYILDGQDQPIYAFRGSERADPAAYRSRSSDLKEVVEVARGASDLPKTDRTAAFTDKQDRYKFLKGALQSARWGAKITLIDGKPAIIASITIVPNVDLSLLRGRPYLLVTVIQIDAEFIDAVGGSLLIPKLHFTSTDRSGGNVVSQPFETDDGQSGGWLTWTTSQPGQPLLTIVLPLLLVGVCGMWLLSARMLRRLTSASMELANREAEARFEASHDALSGLPNRPMFIARLDREMSPATVGIGRSDGPIVGYLDIDRFKDINDTMGHHAGDELIRQVGWRLRNAVDRDCLIARFGGDEFAILHRSGLANEGGRLASVVACAFSAPFEIDGTSIRVTASLGLAQCPQHGRSSEELMRHADIALYVAKKQGRNQTVFFDDEMAQTLEERRRIEVELRQALERNELELFYQPIISSRRNAVTGVEALLRWTHPTMGAVPPSVFIPIAEESGLMLPLGDWVLRQAIRSAADWPDLGVAINLSPAQFCHADLPRMLADLLQETKVEANRITFEITEGLLLDPSTDTHSMLETIRKMGFLIALDDFGTGLSSLKYLIDFRFDKLKIDRSFVTGLSRTKSAQTIIRSVVQLGRAMDMDVVAEGIETHFEASTMQALGCEFIQGFYFSKAIREEEVAPFVSAFEQGSADADTPIGSASTSANAS
ncbi:putative bifunctional diguanylate cyclase/phosphodiesterase [Aureimonas pseudogalii]|uniref:Diguanylate cyclase (GGDEF)-like protein n=1 Tax=Aureimonas pseudogalii TaxID=1744844 RepID=A0A7W6H8M9_9HYPH|nr:EAL domain-containing protein [Aureimonas pseudogalii]MBB4000532.1 diguanylate cyclase (GGDEF)-like protein [Aureimonas pseudogalii]